MRTAPATTPLRIAAGGALLLTLAGCAPPIGVSRVGARAVHRTLTASVLSTGHASGWTRNTVNAWGLLARFEGLAALPVADGIPFHSIIAVKGDGPPETGNDGVVAYRSAHVDGAASELVVRSPHSTQGEPATIQEVRRILHVHGQAVAASGVRCGG